MAIYHTLRLALFGVVLLLSVIILGLSANIDAVTGVDVTFASLALAISLITMLTIIPIAIIERVRQGAFTSLLFIELIWIGVLWVLWLATAAEAATIVPDPSLCSSPFLSPAGKTICSSAIAITAFSFINWIALLGWFIALLVFGISGNHWHSSVPDTELHRRTAGAPGSAPNMSNAPGSNPQYPPAQTASPTGGYSVQQPYPQGPQAHTPGSVPV